MIRLATLFSDGAVLQRRMIVPIWGNTTPSTVVRVVCGKAESYGKSSADGRFTVYLPEMDAGGPYEISVFANGEMLTIEDVLIGEVWLAGGQSNMQCKLHPEATEHSEERIFKQCWKQEEEYIDTLVHENEIRSILVPKVASGVVEDDFNGTWKRVDRENSPHVSAIAAWYAKQLREKLQVPIGIIECNWGGTVVEAWTSRSGLMQNPETVQALHVTDVRHREKVVWEKPFCASVRKTIEKDAIKDTENQGVKKGWAEVDFDDTFWKDMEVPGSWIQQMISGNGSIWVRRKVEIPSSWERMPLNLHLGAIDKHDISYFNGVEVGRSGKDFEIDFWDKERNYAIPCELVHGGINVVVVRAFSFLGEGTIGGFPSQNYLENTITKERIPLAGMWKAYPENDYGVLNPSNDPVLKYCYDCPNVPATLFNSMVHPLIPYAMRGVIWYQGESNANTPAEAMSYYDKLYSMINDWRYQWGQGDFPFIQMILAGYRNIKSYDAEEAWPILREAQIRICQNMANVYAASAIDIGDESDIHPPNKKEAGLRMARIALAKVYGLVDIVPSGPRMKECEYKKHSILLSFENGEGLFFRNGNACGFHILDARGKVVQPKSITILGNMVQLTLPENATPAEIYYAWADNPDGNLVNGAGLPADPFKCIL